MDRYKRKSYLQAALKVGEKYIITAFDNKRSLQKEKKHSFVQLQLTNCQPQTINFLLVFIYFVSNGLDP